MKAIRLMVIFCSVLVLAGVFSVPSAAAQGTRTTASEVVDRETLKAFALSARDYISSVTDINQLAELADILREEGGDWNSGNMYLNILLQDGILWFHGDDPELDGTDVRDLEDDNGVKVVQAMLAVAESMGDGGFVEYAWDDPSDPNDENPKVSYAVKYTSPLAQGTFFFLVAGFYQDISDVENIIDTFPDPPAVTAPDVVDRETLKAFVQGAIAWTLEGFEEFGLDFAKLNNEFRREGGPWRQGSTYLYVMTADGYVLFHGSRPDQQGKIQIERQDRNGFKFVKALIDAALAGGDYVEYYWDDPSVEGDEDLGSAKVGYAESFMIADDSPIYAGQTVVIGSGFYTGDQIVPSAAQPFSITDRGGVSLSSRGSSPSPLSGYGQVAVDEGMTPPAGLAIFGFRQNGVLVSEAGVPAVPAVLEGRIFAETDVAVRTGLAIANPNDGPATIGFFLTDGNGMDYGHGSFTLGPREQRARFLDEDPFNGGSGMMGTFTFTSNQPVAVTALRGFVNERSEFLMTTLPVAPLSAGTADTVHFSHFTDGAGWTTQVILVNPTGAPIQGSVEFRSPGSETEAVAPATLTLDDGRSGTTFSYAIPPRSATRLRTSNPAGSTQQRGSIRVVADPGSPVPSGVSVFAYERDGVTVSEAGVPASDPGAAFRVYVETNGAPGAPGAVRSGIALTNTSGTAAEVTFELTALDGTSTGPAAFLSIPASGQVTLYIDDIFPGLITPFSGILRIASIPRTPFHSRTGNLAIIGLRMTINERSDVVVTTTPPSDETSTVSASDLFFPHFVDSGGWTTQFILYSGSTGQTSSGSLRFTGQNGQPLELLVAPTTAPTIP